MKTMTRPSRPEGALLAVRVQPRAQRSAVGGWRNGEFPALSASAGAAGVLAGTRALLRPVICSYRPQKKIKPRFLRAFELLMLYSMLAMF